jgi:hypothetical protein
LFLIYDCRINLTFPDALVKIGDWREIANCEKKDVNCGRV